MPRKDTASLGGDNWVPPMTKGEAASSDKGGNTLDLFNAGSPVTMATVACDTDEYGRLRDAKDRRLYLYGAIEPVDFEMFGIASTASRIVEQIVNFNREDRGIPPEERKPIRLYINSPGGELIEGFALISAIELSKTPVWTINMGQWSSMAFLIGITGDKRWSLPNSMFLMHDGTSGAFGSASKVQDQMKFEERFEKEVVKPHVLKHSCMKEAQYDASARVEFYMLPQDALAFDFIDEIVNDIDLIL